MTLDSDTELRLNGFTTSPYEGGTAYVRNVGSALCPSRVRVTLACPDVGTACLHVCRDTDSQAQSMTLTGDLATLTRVAISAAQTHM